MVAQPCLEKETATLKRVNSYRREKESETDAKKKLWTTGKGKVRQKSMERRGARDRMKERDRA